MHRIGLDLLLTCGLSMIGFSQPAAQYTISTVAGTGSLNQDGPATAATLILPWGCAVDSTGNLYISDVSGARIFRVASDGVISSFAGSGVAGFSGDGGPATVARLQGPFGMAVDGSGGIYFADEPINRIRRVNPNGTIETVAGTGIAGFSGDGQPATSAMLTTPWGVAVDTIGNIYIADTNNERIRKIDSSGTITTIAGTGPAAYGGDGGPATRAQLNGPIALSVDSAGNLYIADQNNMRVRKVTAAGVISTFAGTGQQGNAGSGTAATAQQLSNPGGVASDAAGNLYIADSSNHRVLKVTPAGAASTIAGTGIAGYGGDGKAATAAQLNLPRAVAADSAGNIYVVDENNRRVRKITPNGIIKTAAGTFDVGDGGPASKAALSSSTDLVFDATGNLYLTDSPLNLVRKITPAGIISNAAGSGSRGFAGDGGPASAASLLNPNGLALDATGNLYIADTSNHRIRKVDTRGSITTVAGGGPGFAGDGSDATMAQLSAPNGVAVDASGAVYIADTGNHRIRKISRGTINTIAGTGVAGFGGDAGQAAAARLSSPQGVIVDGAGNLYVADTNNHRIRRISPAGVITTVAGTGTAGAAGDGGPAISAQLRFPAKIAIDRKGNLFIADSGNQRIRRIGTDGAIATVAGNGTAGFNGDGGLATLAQLNSPRAVAIDDAGSVYIADASNYRVRKVALVQVSIDAVRNGGSLLPGPVSAGEIVTITGTGLGPDQAVGFELDASGVVTTQLGGTKVLFDGSPAPMLSAQATQVTAVVPYGVAGNSSTQVQVEVSGSRSSPVTAPVAGSAPGIFTADSSGTGQGAITNEDKSMNSPSQPAAKGSLVTILCTGEGQTDPAGVDGKLAGDTAPVPLLPASLTIGGMNAEIEFSR